MRTLRMLIMSLIGVMLLLSIIVLPVQSQTSPVWRAAYYDNPYFEDPPVLERVDERIAFDWGAGSPASNIPATNFSVRWGTDVMLSAGTYRFYVMADEEVKISIDFQPPIINTFGNSRIGQIVTADVDLSAGEHHIQVDYRELSGVASIYFSFESLSDGASGPDFAHLQATPTSSTPSVLSQGTWTASYYENAALVGNPVVVREETTPSNNWGAGSPDPRIPADNWSARWTRYISLNQGTYRVTARADDGVRVFINNIPVISQWNMATGQTYTSDISLPAGLHDLRVEFFEGAGGASLYVDIEQIGPQSPVSPTTATATINTGRLNVRNAPSAITGQILTKVDYGDTFRALGFNASRTWVQINVYGTVGWVNRTFVNLSNADTLPVVDGTVPVNTPVQVTTYTVTAQPFNVNIRTGPGTGFEDIGDLPAGSVAQVIGRNSSSTWWQINYQGIVGWVSAVYARIESGANVSNIPIRE